MISRWFVYRRLQFHHVQLCHTSWPWGILFWQKWGALEYTLYEVSKAFAEALFAYRKVKILEPTEFTQAEYKATPIVSKITSLYFIYVSDSLCLTLSVPSSWFTLGRIHVAGRIVLNLSAGSRSRRLRICWRVSSPRWMRCWRRWDEILYFGRV